MRSNIRDIIKALNCTEERAKEVEDYIDRHWLLDWSECTMAELKAEAIYADNAMKKGGI